MHVVFPKPRIKESFLPRFESHLRENGYPDVTINAQHPYEALSGGISRQTLRLHCMQNGEAVDFIVSVEHTHDWPHKKNFLPPTSILDIQNKMADAGVPTPKPIGSVEELPDGLCFKIKPVIEDAHYMQNPTDEQMRQLGRLVGKLHLVGMRLDVDVAQQCEAKEKSKPPILKRVRALSSRLASNAFNPNGPSWKDVAAMRNNKSKALVERKDLPNGILHGDLNAHNILLDKDENFQIIDWELSRPGALLHEVVRTIMSHSVVADPDGHEYFKPDQADMFLQGYNEVRPLTPIERKEFPHAMTEYTARAAVIQPLNHHHKHAADWRQIKQDVAVWLRAKHPMRQLQGQGEMVISPA